MHLGLSIIVAFEVARAELKQLIFGSMLPSEVKQSVHENKHGIDQVGFVLLVDAVGYALDRKRFDNGNERAIYLEQLANRMLEPIARVKNGNFSILSCTGDGIYCAIPGLPSIENFHEISNLAFGIIQNDATQSGNDCSIKFRAAFGYAKVSGNFRIRQRVR